MQRKHIIYIAVLLLISVPGIFSCRKKSQPTPAPATDTVVLTPDTIKAPLYFPKPVIPDDNQPCKEIEKLGRMLYYDPILSNDGRFCGGCHIQGNGFTSLSLYNNVMPVLPHENLAWYTNFMWDGSKSGTLEDIMLFEVKEFFGTDLNKLNQSATYKPLFKNYFKTDTITYKEVAYSLAQFIRTLVCGSTKYDRSLRGLAILTPDENMGSQIFFTEKGDCFHCHVNPVMTDNLFHNTGLDSIYAKDADKGYYNVTGNPSDLGKFRTPNLRNVALKTHFMHDGRFTTLDEVIDFYDHEMYKVNNLDPIMSLPQKAQGLHLNSLQKSQLIAFLKTLTDSTFITNPDFSNPH